MASTVSQEAPAPSEWRLNMLKRMRSAPVVTNTSIDVTQPETKRVKVSYTFKNKYDDTQYAMHTAVKQKSGEKYPKIIYEDKPRKATPAFTLAPMTVYHSYLGRDGDLNIRTKNKDSARYVLKIGVGVSKLLPDSLKSYVTAEKQEACLDWARSLGQEALEYASHDDEVWPELPKDDDFVEKGNLAYMKTVVDDEKEHDVIVLQSRLDDYNGNSNEPRFWRKTKDGEYVQEKIDELTPGSIVVPRASFRLWGGDFSKNPLKKDFKWGASADLGRDIVIVWRAPKREYVDSDTDEDQETGSTQAILDDVPYVEDW